MAIVRPLSPFPNLAQYDWSKPEIIGWFHSLAFSIDSIINQINNPPGPPGIPVSFDAALSGGAIESEGFDRFMPQGQQGPVGLPGIMGPFGMNGIDGEEGAIGPQGIQGTAGERGPPGIDGESTEDTIIIGTENRIFPSTDIGLFGSHGLTAQNNTTTPNTQFDIDADSVVLWETTNFGIVVRNNVSSITNDVSTAGPAANGRDQSGAFSASSWIHFYWIWNGTTLATVSSTVAPPTGPTLPTGYTHWSYVGAVRFNASSALLRTNIRGSIEYYEIDDGAGAATRVLSSGASTTFANVSLTSIIPPNALSGYFTFIISLVHNATASFSISIRPGGTTTLTTGVTASQTATQVANQNPAEANSVEFFFVAGDISIDYKISTAPSTSGGAFINVHGFSIPNGG